MTELLSGDDVIVLTCCTSLSFILSSYERMFGDLVSVTMNFTVEVLPRTVTVADIEPSDTMFAPPNAVNATDDVCRSKVRVLKSFHVSRFRQCRKSAPVIYF